MRFICFSLFTISLLLACLLLAGQIRSNLYAEVEAPEMFRKEQQLQMEFLGQRLLNSLKEDNSVAFAQCWISWDLMFHLQGISLEKYSDRKDELWQDGIVRDRFVGECFPLFRDYLNEFTKGNLSQVEVETVTGKFTVEDSASGVVLISGDILVTFRIDADTLLRFHMDDGVSVGGGWYFSDKPRKIKIIKKGEVVESLKIRKLLEEKSASQKNIPTE